MFKDSSVETYECFNDILIENNLYSVIDENKEKNIKVEWKDVIPEEKLPRAKYILARLAKFLINLIKLILKKYLKRCESVKQKKKELKKFIKLKTNKIPKFI